MLIIINSHSPFLYQRDQILAEARFGAPYCHNGSSVHKEYQTLTNNQQIYFLGCSFCVSACLLFFGYSIYDEISCRAAIFLGLVFYLGQKACLYLFLVERTHSVQKKLLTRMKDKIYLSGMALVLIGFTSIGIAAFMYHVASYDEEQNICRIGLTRRIAIILLSWDIFVNIFLTFVFLKVCAPYMSRGYLSTFLKPVLKGTLEKLAFFHKYTKESEQDVGISQKALVKVIRKAVWGCLGLLPSTIINFTLLIVFAGRQKAWFFLTFATLDGKNLYPCIH